jgi:hypothetical protein
MMTTIAYRDGLIAGESLSSSGSAAYYATIKIARNRKGDLAASMGELSYSAMFLAWFMRGEKGSPPSARDASDPKETNSGIIIRASTSQRTMFEFDHVFTTEIDGYFSMGSGRDFAAGAMAQGGNAIDAVRAACKHDVYSGGPIRWASWKSPGGVHLK